MLLHFIRHGFESLTNGTGRVVLRLRDCWCSDAALSSEQGEECSTSYADDNGSQASENREDSERLRHYQLPGHAC